MSSEAAVLPTQAGDGGGGSRTRKARGHRTRGGFGWLFIAPFLIVFVLFLVIPLGFAFYLSLFSKGLATGTVFSGLANYVQAFTDPSFLRGILFVVVFTAVLVPIQMVLSVAAALVLDALASRFARVARLAIFLPYAIPAVIGALMWGFLYSPSFGPVNAIFGLIGVPAPFLLGPGTIFGALINVVTWQWAGYYMIIVFAALQGIDPAIYEAARIDGANSWQVALRVKLPIVMNSLVLILVFAVIGTLQFFTEPQILAPVANGTVTQDFTPNIYAYNLAFNYAQFNYASAISFALGAVIFVAVYIFLFLTRKRGSIFA